MRRLSLVMTALFLMALSASSANAVLVTYNYQAEINFSSLPSVSVGDIVTGSFAYDTSVPDQNPGNTDYGAYNQLGVTGARLSYNVAGLSDEYSPSNADSLGVFITSGGPAAILDELTFLGTRSDTAAHVTFFDFTGNAITSDALPASIALADFDVPFFDFVIYFSGANSQSIQGPITALQRVDVSEVPLPPAIWLFLSGLAVMCMTAWRRASGKRSICQLST